MVYEYFFISKIRFKSNKKMKEFFSKIKKKTEEVIDNKEGLFTFVQFYFLFDLNFTKYVFDVLTRPRTNYQYWK